MLFILDIIISLTKVTIQGRPVVPSSSVIASHCIAILPSNRALRDPETNTIDSISETEPTKQAQILEKHFSYTMKAVNIKGANICQKTHPEIVPENKPTHLHLLLTPSPSSHVLQRMNPKGSSREGGSTPKSLIKLPLLNLSKLLAMTNLQAQTA